MQVDPTSERAVWRNIDAANLHHDVHVVATTTNTTPWFQGTIGERLLQKWGYKHAFKAPKLPNTRYALVQHEFRGLKTDDERYTEAELHVDGCNIMFDWADKGITNVYARLGEFVTACRSIQLIPIVYFDFERGGRVSDRKYVKRLIARIKSNDVKLPVHFTALLGTLLSRLGVATKYVSGVTDAAIFLETKAVIDAGGNAFVYSRDWGFVYASQREFGAHVGDLRHLQTANRLADGCARCEWGTNITIPGRKLGDITTEWAPGVMSQPYALFDTPWQALRDMITQTKTLHVRHEHANVNIDDHVKFTMLRRMTPLYGALAALVGLPKLAIRQPMLLPTGKLDHRIVIVGPKDSSVKVVRTLRCNPPALIDAGMIRMARTNPKALDFVMETWMVVCVVNGEDAGCRFVEWI